MYSLKTNPNILYSFSKEIYNVLRMFRYFCWKTRKIVIIDLFLVKLLPGRIFFWAYFIKKEHGWISGEMQ